MQGNEFDPSGERTPDSRNNWRRAQEPDTMEINTSYHSGDSVQEPVMEHFTENQPEIRAQEPATSGMNSDAVRNYFHSVAETDGNADSDFSSHIGADFSTDTPDRPAENSQEAPVDYRVASGQRESIGTTFSTGNAYDEYGYQNETMSNAGTGNQTYGEYQNFGTGHQTDYSSWNAPSGPPASDNQQTYENYQYTTASGSNPYPDPNGGGPSDPSDPFGTPGKKEKKPKKKRSSGGLWKRVLASALVICLCGLAGFGGGALAVNRFGGSSGSGAETKNVKIDTSTVSSLDATSAIAEKVMPSVVGISTQSQTYTQSIFGLQQGTVTGIGTGIIVSEDGYILTNSHVVDDGNSTSITVDLYDGSEHEGTVLWNDSSLDLAVVKIDASDLTAAELGDSDEVKIGDYAVAVGNPLGLNFERSVTQGIISGLNRSITTTNASGSSANTMDGLIQTDASINSGNSGGPLVNAKGEVIGINTAKASSAEGLGFAIPVNTAVPIIREIKESGTYEQPYLGITGYDLANILENNNIDVNAKEGVFVNQIYTNSPASEAGLQEGDIITQLNDTSIDGMSTLKSTLVKYRPGDQVTLTVEREKASVDLTVTLGKTSDSTPRTINPNSMNGGAGSSDGNNGQNGGNNNGGNNGNGNGNYGGGSIDDFFNYYFGN